MDVISFFFFHVFFCWMNFELGLCLFWFRFFLLLFFLLFTFLLFPISFLLLTIFALLFLLRWGCGGWAWLSALFPGTFSKNIVQVHANFLLVDQVMDQLLLG